MKLSTTFALLSALTGCLASRFSKHDHVLTKRRVERPAYGRSDGCKDMIAPKVFVITHMSSERDVYTDPDTYGLYAVNVTVPGLCPLFPSAHCDKKGEVCLVTTGEGDINAASTITSLSFSPYFDLRKTYFLVSGIAGISPTSGTIGSVAFSKYAVQFGLAYEFDAREMPDGFETGYVALGATTPEGYPVYIYGSEVFELNANLRDRAVDVASKHKLNDSDVSVEYRTKYKEAAAHGKPAVIKGDTTTSDVYFHGAKLASAAENTLKILTNGTGFYTMSAQEDNGTLTALLRGALAKRVDFNRVIIMRSGAAFDRSPPGVSEAQSLFTDDEGAFGPSLINLGIAGGAVIEDIKRNWKREYEKGIKANNYVGDIFGSLGGDVPMDIGSAFHQEG